MRKVEHIISKYGMWECASLLEYLIMENMADRKKVRKVEHAFSEYGEVDHTELWNSYRRKLNVMRVRMN